MIQHPRTFKYAQYSKSIIVTILIFMNFLIPRTLKLFLVKMYYIIIIIIIKLSLSLQTNV